MVTPQSPSHMFNGLDEDICNEAKFADELNYKMRVPKRIKATGEFSDEDILLSNQNGMINSWNYNDKIDMNVPDRIVVLGNNQHLETRSAPREIQLENSILSKNRLGFVRVQTPPRSITLNEHHFPSASDENSPIKMTNCDDLNDDEFDDDYNERPPPYVTANGVSSELVGFQTNDYNSVDSDSQLTTGGAKNPSSQGLLHNGNDTSMLSHRGGTPIGDLPPHEEILYLRRQLAKINRRVLNIEIKNEQRMQREQIMWCLGLGYFVLKTLVWLTRN